MPATLNMKLKLRERFANRKGNKSWNNDAWPTYTRQQSRPSVYYVEPGSLRNVGFADELAHGIRHQGWYTDREFQDEVMRGVVWALPGKNRERRLVAGYVFTGGDDKGATLFFDEIFDNEIDAARMADEHARVAAEHECDYQDQEREKLAAEEAEEERLDNLAACHPPLHVEA